MNKKWKKFALIYITIGLFWATFIQFPFRLDLKSYEGESSYWNDITEVTEGYLSTAGDLTICFKGRLINSQISKGRVEVFSINIPKERFWNNEYTDNDWYEFNDKGIQKKCPLNNKESNISIVNLDLTAGQADSFDSKGLEKLEVDNEKKYTIYYFPKTYENNGFHFKESLKVYIIGMNNELNRVRRFKLYFKDTWIDKDIGFHDYAIAFVKDALFYPFAIIMMGMWGH